MTTDGDRASGRLPISSRAQSETLGFILVFSIMVIGALVVVALGATAISDTEDQLSEERAEKALTQFDSKAGLVALGEADAQLVSFTNDDGEDFRVFEDRGWMNVTVTDRETGDEMEVMNTTLGALVYEGSNGPALAYQGGGVWRVDESGGQMVSPPEFHYRNGTLTLPTINITGELDFGPTARISRGDVNQTFPVKDDPDRMNPLTNHEVVVTVQSEFYQGWAHYFEERTDGSTQLDHDEETVTVRLRTPVGETRVVESIGSTSTAGHLSIQGEGTVEHNSDSYDSRVGPYDESRSGEGNITLAGDFDAGSATISVNGSIESGGEVECHQNAEITGAVWASSFEDIDDCDDAAEGGAVQVGSLDFDTFTLNPFIDLRVEEIAETNNNDETSAIDDEELDWDGGSQLTLEAGNYYLEELVVGSGQELTIQTDTDQVTRLAVENFVHLDEGDIVIEGDGKVKTFVKGEATVDGTHHFKMYRGTFTTAANVENATQNWIYGKDTLTADLDGSQGNPVTVEGVFYAPTLLDDTAAISSLDMSHATVYGGIIMGDVDMHQSSVAYDEALRQAEALPEDAEVITINFLHVTENELVIEPE